jgi:hypothetical protein
MVIKNKTNINYVKAYVWNTIKKQYESSFIEPKFDIPSNGIVKTSVLKQKIHPCNNLFYKDNSNSEEKHIDDLINGTSSNDEFSFKKRMEDGVDRVNHEPIKVCPITGIVMSGNTRVKALLKIGAKYCYVQYADHVYSKETPISVILDTLQKYNVSGKRNEYSKSSILKKFKELAFAKEKETGEALNPRKKIFKEFIRNFLSTYSLKDYELNILFRIDTIQNKKIKEDLLKNLDQYTYNDIKKITSSNKNKIIKVYNPNRFKFVEHLKNTPSLKEEIRHKISDKIIKLKEALQLRSKRLEKNVELLTDKVFGFESNATTAIFSHLTMSAVALAYDNHGMFCKTAASDKGSDDMYFPNLSEKAFKINKNFYREMLDVKACNFCSSFFNTKIYGGPGFLHIAEHEYIWPVFNDNFSKIFIMMATLNKNDVKPDSKGGTVSLSDWFKNHFEKKDFHFIAGKIFQGNKVPEIEWENVEDLLNPKTDKEVI